METSIADMFSEVLRCDSVKLTDSFFDLGGRSFETIALVAAIEARFGVRIHPTALIESPTVEKLAALVCNPNAQSAGTVVPFRRTGAKLPLFCVHGGNGSALPFRDLAKSLGWNQPFYGLQVIGAEDGYIPYISIEDMATQYIKEIRRVQPAGPIHIAGWSSGGLVAFEIARQLKAANQNVGLLALLDCEAPLSIFQLRAFSKCAKTHLDRLLGTNFRRKLNYIATILGRRMGVAAFCVKYRICTKIKGKPPQDYHDLPHVLAIAEQRYIAKSYSGAAVLLRTADVAAGFPDDPTLGWGTLVRGGLDIRDIPGDHYSIMREPYVRTLADHLGAGTVCAT